MAQWIRRSPTERKTRIPLSVLLHVTNHCLKHGKRGVTKKKGNMKVCITESRNQNYSSSAVAVTTILSVATILRSRRRYCTTRLRHDGLTTSPGLHAVHLGPRSQFSQGCPGLHAPQGRHPQSYSTPSTILGPQKDEPCHGHPHRLCSPPHTQQKWVPLCPQIVCQQQQNNNNG